MVAPLTIAGGACSGNAPSESIEDSSQAVSPGFVQTAWTAPQSPLATVTVPLGQAQLAGDLNAIAVGWNDTTRSITSVTDANNNVYQLAAATKRGNGLSQAIYIAPSIKAGSNTVTVRFDGAASFVDLRVAEYAGLTGAIDAVASNAGSGGDATSTAFSTTAPDLIFAAGMTSGAFTSAGSGFTVRAITSPDADLAEDEILSIPGSINASAPQNGDWVMQAVALKLSAGAPDAGGAPDSGPADAGHADSGQPDSGQPDAGMDAGPPPTCVLPTVPNPPARTFTYPLKASANNRYLVDQANKPFLVAGDAPQCLTVNASVDDAIFFFQNRAAQGFNAAWVNLLCSTYTGGPSNGKNIDGVAPFTSPANTGDVSQYDLATPNEAFFCRVDQMVSAAAQYNTVVFLDPIETGSFLGLLRNQGVAKARAYGQYLGNRYKNVPNIVWMHGNDFQSFGDATDNALVLAVAQGIKDVDPNHLQTMELDFIISGSLDATTVSSAWSGILGINESYSYPAQYQQITTDYNRTNHLPDIMIEGNYEGEALSGASHSTNAHDVRTQYYWSDLSGATGSFYGSALIDFVQGAWKNQVLTAPGGLQFQYVQKLFTPRAWQNLVPDQGHTVVTAGLGNCTPGLSANAQNNDCATTARTPDGTLVISYMPTARAITVDMTKLNGTTTARFYDPTNGNFTVVSGSPFPNTGTRTFTPPAGNHGDGFNDWVLLLETNTPPDTTPPSVPSALSATAISSAAVNLAFNASTDNVGVAFYQVFRCQGAGCTPSAQVGTSTTTSFSDAGLSPSTAYVYAVAAVDTSGNTSAKSTPASATTAGLPDGGAGDMASFVQVAAATPQSSLQTVGVSYPQAQQGGSLDIVVVGWNSATQSITSVVDSNNNPYALAASIVRSGTLSQAIYYAPNVKAGANTVTVTFDGAVAFPDVRIAEYAGLRAAVTAIQSAGATGTASTASAGPVTVTGSGQLVFAAGITTGGFSGAGSGFATRIITQPDLDIAEDLIATGPGSFTATAGVSAEWVMQVVSFQ